MAASSSPLRRSVKWYGKIIFYMILSTSVVNSLHVFKCVTGKKFKITEFKESLVIELFKKLINCLKKSLQIKSTSWKGNLKEASVPNVTQNSLKKGAEKKRRRKLKKFTLNVIIATCISAQNVSFLFIKWTPGGNLLPKHCQKGYSCTICTTSNLFYNVNTKLFIYEP